MTWHERRQSFLTAVVLVSATLYMIQCSVEASSTCPHKQSRQFKRPAVANHTKVFCLTAIADPIAQVSPQFKHTWNPWWHLLLTPWVFRIIPVDGSLTPIWTYQTGDSGFEKIHALAVDPNDNAVVIGGIAQGTVNGEAPQGSYDFLAIKLDTDGVVEWTYRVGDGAAQNVTLKAAIDASGNVFLAGEYEGNGLATPIGQMDLTVVKLNSAGALQWAFKGVSTGNDRADCLAVDTSGNIVVGGYTTGVVSGHANQGGQDSVLLKLNSAGVQQWLLSETMSTSGTDGWESCVTDSSDNIYVTGTFIRRCFRRQRRLRRQRHRCLENRRFRHFPLVLPGGINCKG